jgi:hypothetical protein
VDVAHFDETDHTWVKGAFQTIDRPYGSLINLLHHGEATHARECLCTLARSSFFVFVAVLLALFLSLSLFPSDYIYGAAYSCINVSPCELGIGSTHVVHHLCPAVPHYHAWRATAAIKATFPHLYLYGTRRPKTS